NGGSWNGGGLTSSSARTNSRHNTTLGLLWGSDYIGFHGAGAKFDGETIGSTDLLVKYTYYGDTDFNGMVDFDDYTNTDLGFNPGGNRFAKGDADGTGWVDFDDYILIDLAFNTQSAVL